MTLQEKIQNDLKEAINNRDKDTTNYLKVIVGELQRLPHKELKDDIVVSTIKKLIKYQKENIKKYGMFGQPVDDYLRLLESYVPKQASEEDIKKWIKDNIDLSQFKNKMQAMKPIMVHFGSTVNGRNVRKILEEWER